MSWFPIPSVGEERADAVRRLHPALPAQTPWRHNGLLLSIVFSVLAAIAVLALFGFFAITFTPLRGLLAAALAIGTSEWLIRKHHFFGTGIESSLWLFGTFAFIFGLPSSGKIEALLVFAAASALSGWRMRNAFFGVLAAILVIVYIAFKWEHIALLPMALAAALAIAAAAGLRRVWQRPSTERLLTGFVVVMPVTGYLAAIAQQFTRSSTRVGVPVVLLLGALTLLFYAAGIAWRDRALLLSATLSAAMTAIELRDLLDYPVEAKLIAAGVSLIVVAVTLSRALRLATRGFVVTPVPAGVYEEAMQIGGIISVAPHGQAPASHAHTGPDLADSAGPTDKSYGGGGAGGGF